VIVVGDIGGTNARFATINQNDPISFSSLKKVRKFECYDFKNFDAAINKYLNQFNINPSTISLAVAGPVDGNIINFTNNKWKFSKSKFKIKFNLSDMLTINDFVAQAIVIPHLTSNHKTLLRNGSSIKNTPIIALGPGTGLGFSGLLPTENDWRPLETEGGNTILSTNSKLEEEIREWLKDKENPVIFETVLSGRGLENIYEFLIHKHKFSKKLLTAKEIAETALTGSNFSIKAIKIFFNFLGSFIANCILTTGARNSVYIAGGMVPKIIKFLGESEFYHRVSEHGRYSDYIGKVPIYLSSNPNAGLLGARAALNNNNLKHRLI
jgi:glucokinase